MAAPSAQTLPRIADETGHQAGTLEKALRLLDLLQEIARDPVLADRLVLKGGTALNLFHLRLDRLSVDIDLNYVGALDRAAMEAWKVLIAGERTETRGLATGIAEVAPGAKLMCHRHEPAEIYFIVSGRGEMEIEDRSQPVEPGCAIYIPPDVRHALRCTGAACQMCTASRHPILRLVSSLYGFYAKSNLRGDGST